MKVTIIVDGSIPQIGDDIWTRYKAHGRIEGTVLSILSVKYDERLRLKIEYKIKVTKIHRLKSLKPLM